MIYIVIYIHIYTQTNCSTLQHDLFEEVKKMVGDGEYDDMLEEGADEFVNKTGEIPEGIEDNCRFVVISTCTVKSLI